MPAEAAEQANQQLVDRMIAQGALWSRPLIAAFRSTPRHRFLHRIFHYQRKHAHWRELITREPGAEELRLLYADRALITRLSPPGREGPGVPISSSSQPSLMAQMLEDLLLGPGQRVLEIGAGTGYNAALLAHVAGPGRVVTVDVDREVLAEAWDHLRAFPERAVELRHADGRAGHAEGAPYDRLMVTAATPDLEPAWLQQLAEGGILVAPLALAPGLAYVIRGRMRGGVFEGRLTRAAYFMSLRAEGEPGNTDTEAPPRHNMLQKSPAPWANWFDRKRQRFTWPGFVQAMAFYGLLRGLRVFYQALADGQPAYGVWDAGSNTLCWLGSEHWHATGDAGRELAWKLWQAFLEAGGPWPTEFSIRVSPRQLLASDMAESYIRQGPRCWQAWELLEARERPSAL